MPCSGCSALHGVNPNQKTMTYFSLGSILIWSSRQQEDVGMFEAFK